MRIISTLSLLKLTGCIFKVLKEKYTDYQVEQSQFPGLKEGFETEVVFSRQGNALWSVNELATVAISIF